MSKRTSFIEPAQIVETILGSQQSVERRAAILQELRDNSPDLARECDVALLLDHARQREVLHKLVEPPLIPAIVLHTFCEKGMPWAKVLLSDKSMRAVPFGDGVGTDSVTAGDEVFLSNAQNTVQQKAPDSLPPPGGDTGYFERWLPDGQMTVRCRDEQLTLSPSGKLIGCDFKRGDLVVFNREATMALRRIEPEAGEQFLLTEVPAIGPEAVGGQNENLDRLLWALTARFLHRPKAALYGLEAHNILLSGPPGCGKTLLARVGVSEVHRLTGVPCRFSVVKPGEWEDPYVGVTKANIRQTFKALREAAAEGYAVLFLDEIDGIGRMRGERGGLHSDSALVALLAEVDGFSELKNVAVIGATNRKDVLDPGLRERLSGLELSVRRPDLRGAKAIFNIHLGGALPFSPNGAAVEQTRIEIIENAVSRLYSPNAGNELCELRFRDRKTRIVAARELMSGRVISQICRTARALAFRRDVSTGSVGVQCSDMEQAVAEAIDRLRITLTIHNAHAYLDDLPQDMDLVSVEPIVRKVSRPQQYLNIPA